MLLLLVRHARASERDADRWPDDSLRPLTNLGREFHSEMSRGLSRLDCPPEAVLTSPWVRARQTADLMVEEMELDLEPIECEALARDVDLEAIRKAVEELGRVSVVALVGHSPWMEELASLLLTGDPHGLLIDFPKSAVMALDTDRIGPRAAALRFFLRPKHVRDLRRRKKVK
ncbi:MAG TPA: histidine phosphatase family protein [Gemmatimonadales bacterium]